MGFIVNNRGIEANPAKVHAVLDLQSSNTVKGIQKSAGMVAAFSRFVAQSTNKCQPFYQALRKRKNLEWTVEYEEAFQGINS